MKKNKKLSEGMTLVEVIVAMTIFIMMSGVIITSVVFAVKTSNHGKMRDNEISDQQNKLANIEEEKAKTTDQGVKVVEKTAGVPEEYTLKLQDESGNAVTDSSGKNIEFKVNMWSAEHSDHNKALDFNLKTIEKP